jgi:hypothetical protein
MARIRSIHPSLWTDDRFVGLSVTARLFLIGMWNEADDYGVVEWKPLRLKMRLAPADDINADAILAEIQSADFIVKIERAGKPYAVVKNFRKFQRPKKPGEPLVPVDEEIARIIDLKKEPEKGNEHPSTDSSSPKERTDREKSPQMEDVGGVREDEGKKESIRPVASATRPSDDADFDEFWKAYPSRGKSDNPRKPSKALFLAAVKSGVLPKTIIDQARDYAQRCRDERIYGTQHVAQAMTWLRQARWEGSDFGSVECTAYNAKPGSMQWVAWKTYFTDTGSKFMADRMTRAEFEEKPYEAMPHEWPPGFVSHETNFAPNAQGRGS